MHYFSTCFFNCLSIRFNLIILVWFVYYKYNYVIRTRDKLKLSTLSRSHSIYQL